MKTVVISIGLMMSACSTPPTWVWALPPGFPEPAVPNDNPMSAAKVELGRRLFYELRLSRNGTQSCASCHAPDKAFTDGKAQAVGSTQQQHRRNSPTLTNIAYAAALTWANPLITTLEKQAQLPILGETPVELGWAGHDDELAATIAGDADYAKRFEAAFPAEHGAVSLTTITQAIAAFERTLLSGNAPWDRYQAGDQTAVSAAAIRGNALFTSERFECYHCHTGFTFTDSVVHAGTANPERTFHNTGLYDLDRQGSYPRSDQGLIEVTSLASDMGRFKGPTLRNLAYTAPYMHDGSIATLGDVIDAYAAGGRAAQLSGHRNPLQSEFLRGFTLSNDEKADLLEFLNALNDEGFVANQAFANP